MFAEMEPDPNERPDFTEDYSQELAIYRGHLYAISLHDVGDLTYYKHEISRVKNPFAEDVDNSTDKLADSILDNNNVRHFRERALRDSLRAYVYSGLEIDPILVHLTTMLALMDKRWLQDAIEPTKRLMSQFKDEDIEDARSYGLSAMRKLGILPTRLLFKA
jgi:hypothetical protein